MLYYASYALFWVNLFSSTHCTSLPLRTCHIHLLESSLTSSFWGQLPFGFNLASHIHFNRCVAWDLIFIKPVESTRPHCARLILIAHTETHYFFRVTHRANLIVVFRMREPVEWEDASAQWREEKEMQQQQVGLAGAALLPRRTHTHTQAPQ